MRTPDVDWIDAIALDDLPPGRGRVIFVAGRPLAAWRIGDEVHVLANDCPHAGASLAGGKLEGCVVQCPAHGLRFDVRTGCIAGAGTLAVARFDVRIDAGRVRVALPPP